MTGGTHCCCLPRWRETDRKEEMRTRFLVEKYKVSFDSLMLLLLLFLLVEEAFQHAERVLVLLEGGQERGAQSPRGRVLEDNLERQHL